MDIKTKQRLLRIRAQQNRTRPAFPRYESWRYKRLHPPWRRPRGIDNKTRQKVKQGIAMPETGYYGPKAVKGLHPSGLVDVLVITKKDLEGLSPKVHGIRISRRLGARKKLALIEYAREEGFTILNIGISKQEIHEIEKKETAKQEKKEISNKQAQIQKLKDKGSKKEKEPKSATESDVSDDEEDDEEETQ
jgi:large subunit ribosomal protein L32e